MEGVNPTSSPATLLTNDRTTQTRNPDEQNTLTPPAPPRQDPQRVNEGPSTVTTISPQARQLAEQEQVAANDAPPPPQLTAPADNAPPPPESRQPSAESSQPQTPQQQTPPAQDNGGRVVDDASPNDLLRN